jgi:quercetin dioxygenase-like cupin family protein/DNA-binding XRE family transcriptional regulator
VIQYVKVGNKIRRARKHRRINMKDFAALLGISYLTLYRVETDKVSPSVALLSEIAHYLGEPIINFLSDQSSLTIVKKATAPMVTSGKMNLQLMIPKGVISDKVSVTYGGAKAGEFVSVHSHRGFELTYILKGSALFVYDGQKHKVEEGDLLYFDASVDHAVSALEPHEFLSVYFRR